MNKEQLDKLLEYIDAIVSASEARDSSDGGLIESIRLSEITKELYALVEND